MKLATLKRLATAEPHALKHSEDPRLSWQGHEPQREDREAVLALADYVTEWGHDFVHFEGPQNAPGFDRLPTKAQTLLLRMWALWGHSPRFVLAPDYLVYRDHQHVVELYQIDAFLSRVEMRRKFRGLLRLFAERGDPLYSSHRTYRADAWPERERWTKDERHYLSGRFFKWWQQVRASTFAPHAA